MNNIEHVKKIKYDIILLRSFSKFKEGIAITHLNLIEILNQFRQLKSLQSSLSFSSHSLILN